MLKTGEPGRSRLGTAGRRVVLALGAVICVALAASPAQAEREVAVFKGTGSTTTNEFVVNGPWLLDWSAGGTMSSVLGIEISLLKGEMLRHDGLVLSTHRPGAGTKLFNEGGRYRFRIDSSFVEWRLRVSQITPEEAAQMVPSR